MSAGPVLFAYANACQSQLQAPRGSGELPSYLKHKVKLLSFDRNVLNQCLKAPVPFRALARNSLRSLSKYRGLSL
jgi:hypothetical protein